MTRKVLFLGGVLLSCLGCTVRESRQIEIADTKIQVVQPPGVVEYIWEEPMVDVIEVPPGLDPEGHYYRPAQQNVVEIRQGRWKYYKNPQNSP